MIIKFPISCLSYSKISIHEQNTYKYKKFNTIPRYHWSGINSLKELKVSIIKIFYIIIDSVSRLYLSYEWNLKGKRILEDNHLQNSWTSKITFHSHYNQLYHLSSIYSLFIYFYFTSSIGYNSFDIDFYYTFFYMTKKLLDHHS